MLHKAASVLGVLSLLGACASDAGNDDDEGLVSFHSPVYGYSISHAPSWTVVEAGRALAEGEAPATSSGATDILGRDASIRVNTMQLPGVIVAAQPVADGTSIEEWTSSMIETVSSMKDCDAPSRRDDIEIGGASGILLTYPNCPSDLGYLHLWAGAVHRGLGYHIVWFNEPGDEVDDRASFERMLSSVAFD